MNTPGHPSFLVITLATAALALASTGVRAQHEHGHDHDSATAAIVNLKLDGGEKWPTDASLRKGMAGQTERK